MISKNRFIYVITRPFFQSASLIVLHSLYMGYQLKFRQDQLEIGSDAASGGHQAVVCTEQQIKVGNYYVMTRDSLGLCLR
jgi:hypothetical protein